MNLKHVSAQADWLRIEWQDGAAEEFSALWLSDNRPANRDLHSGQRLVDIADLPPSPKIRGVAVDQKMLQVRWWGDERPAIFDLDWLAEHGHRINQTRPELARRPWLEGAERDAARDFAWLTLSEARTDRSRRARWLRRLLQDDMAFLNNTDRETRICTPSGP